MNNIIRNIYEKWRALTGKPALRLAVIMPVYHMTTFMEEALRSVISQDYANKEIIVVDDGSSAEAAEEIKRICGLFQGITLLRQEHTGAAAARDTGMRHAQAELILFMDADDVLQPGALTFLVRALLRNPQAVAVYGKIMHIDEKGAVINTYPKPRVMLSGKEVLYWLLERNPPFCNGSICIRREALMKLSPNNHTMRYGEDWVLWCHLALSGTIVPAGKRVVLYYRDHETSFRHTQFPEYYDTIFTACYTVYTHPAFIAAIGKEELQKLRERYFNRIYAWLAFQYSHSSPYKAKHYLDKINQPLSALFTRAP